MSDATEALRHLALSLPGTVEGISCAGTALEKRTVQARKKAFLFLGHGDAMVKLRESLPEATTLASEAPGRFRVGAHGWVTATLATDEPPPMDLLERWVEESYRVVVAPRGS